MIKLICTIVLICFISGCTESGTLAIVNTNNGSWVFKSVTYGEANCSYSGRGTLFANSPNGGGSVLNLSFKDTLPAAGGNFNVVNLNPITNTQILIGLNITSGLAAVYAPLTGANQMVAVSIDSNGKVGVSGANILLRNNYTPYDTAALTFNVKQL